MCMCMVTKREDGGWRKIILSIFFLCLFFELLWGSFRLLIQSTSYWRVQIFDYKRTSFRCASLHCTSVLFFKQMEGSWQRGIEQVCRHHLPEACSHFVSSHHGLLIRTTVQTSSVPLYLLSWFVAGNLWCSAPWTHPFAMADVVSVMCVLTAPAPAFPPSLSLCSGLPVHWDTKYWNWVN